MRDSRCPGRARFRALAAAAAFALCGCGAAPLGNSVDAGSGDAGGDDAGMTSDAGHDAGAMADAGPVQDAGNDAGSAAQNDAGSGNWLAHCPSPSDLGWSAATAADDGQGNTDLVISAPGAFGQTYARLRLYSGPTSGLSALPVTQTVSCSGAPCDPSEYSAGYPSFPFSLASGTLTLTQVTTPLSSEVKATLSGLVYNLTENVCTKNDAGVDVCAVQLAPGKACPPIALQNVDTTTPLGSVCSDVSACGTNGKACDPATSTCVASECSSDTDCGSGKLCVVQRSVTPDDGTGASACYVRCDPAASSPCGAQADCVRARGPATAGRWICLAHGPGTAGGVCAPPYGTNTTGCAAGLICVGAIDSSGFPSGAVCETSCDWYAASPGCGAGLRCIVDVCAPPRTAGVDPAAIGSPCMGQLADGQMCGDDGTTYRGQCVTALGLGGTVCKARCELGSTCPGGACTGSGVCP
jgi:hypothetical protein